MSASEDVWGPSESMGGPTPNDIRADNGVNVAARETPAIMRATTQLAQNIEALRDEVQALIETIAPVMTPVDAKVAEPEYGQDMPGGQSDLSNWLRQKAGEISNITMAASFARNRVEL